MAEILIFENVQILSQLQENLYLRQYKELFVIIFI